VRTAVLPSREKRDWIFNSSAVRGIRVPELEA
jgi:hypothetical protein